MFSKNEIHMNGLFYFNFYIVKKWVFKMFMRAFCIYVIFDVVHHWHMISVAQQLPHVYLLLSCQELTTETYSCFLYSWRDIPYATNVELCILNNLVHSKIGFYSHIFVMISLDSRQSKKRLQNSLFVLLLSQQHCTTICL